MMLHFVLFVCRFLCCIQYFYTVKRYPLRFDTIIMKSKLKLECGPMPNLMAAQPNTGGALCESCVIPFLVPRRLADARWCSAVQSDGQFFCDFLRFFASCIFSEPRAAHVRPAS